MRDESEGRVIVLGKFSFSFKPSYKLSLHRTATSITNATPRCCCWVFTGLGSFTASQEDDGLEY